MARVERTFVSPEEVYPGRNVTYAEVSVLAESLNKSEGIKFLGFLNLLLSAATTESHLTNRLEAVRDVQTWILRNVVSVALLRDLRATFREESLLDRPLLHRTQLLFAIRLVATHGQSDGGNLLVERDDFDGIGDLLFLINGLFRVEPATSKAAEPLWVATQMGPMHETENPPDVELTWPRIEDLLIRHLPLAAADPAELERLEQVTVFTTGFNLQAWIDLSWLFFSFWSAASFQELMRDQSRAYLDPNRAHEIISNEALHRAVAGIGERFDELAGYLSIDVFSRATLFDLTPFRAKPLWIMPNGLVFCVDAALLLERMGPHVFWSVMNGLDTPERRRQFTGTWGLAFEAYALESLGQVFRAKKWTFVANPIDEVVNEELCDGLAIRDGAAIVIECKGTFIRSADKYSGIPGQFLRGLSQKFGRVKHGGIHQLVRAISRVWFERVARAQVRHLHAVTEVFPIMVVQDPILGCGPVIRVLSDRFEIAIRRAEGARTHAVPRIWPLTIITADDLDRVSAAVRATGHRLDAILKRFHRTHPSRAVSLSEFLSGPAAGEFGLSENSYAAIRERFNSTTQATMERFQRAEYGRGVDPIAEG